VEGCSCKFAVCLTSKVLEMNEVGLMMMRRKEKCEVELAALEEAVLVVADPELLVPG
jgi:hypothetical protein